MDSTERTGFAAALIIHALFAALLWVAMQGTRAPLPRPESINVSLVGEIAPVSTAPDAVQEEPAAASKEQAPAQVETPSPAAAAPAPVPVVKQAPPPAIKNILPPKSAAKPPKIIPPEKAKPEKTKIAKQQPIAKPPASKSKAAPGNPPRQAGFGKDFEGRIAAIGTGAAAASTSSKAATGVATGAGAAAGQVAAKSGAEVRRSVTAALAGQIRPFLQSCAPSGVDVDKISTFITINLASNGSVNSVSFDRQTGVNDSNLPQADPLKQCAVKAAKQASPYRGLDPEYHDLWKSHKMQLRAR